MPSKKSELSDSVGELKKHVGAIHIRNRLSLLQRKVANVLLLNAYEDLLSKDTHVISVTQLATVAGFDSKDHEVLKKALVGLAETAIEWNLLDANGKDVWRVSTMLAEAEIHGGVCRYAYGRMLREKLYNPEVYARINLAIQRKFSSGHALALYENCSRFRAVGNTGWWEVALFRKLMGIEEREYSDFKDLNKRVIKAAVKQINHQSDIQLTVEYKRKSRKIIALRFFIEDNPQLPLTLSVKEQIMTVMGEDMLENKSIEDASKVAETLHSVAEKEPDITQSGSVIVDRLMQFGLSKTAAVKWSKTVDAVYIDEILDLVEFEYRAGKIRNLPAYTIKALQNDYRPKPVTIAEDVSKAEREKLQAESNRQQAQDVLKSLETDYYRQRLDTALSELSNSAQEALEQDFWDAHKGNVLVKKFRKQGIGHPVVNSVYRAYAKARLLGDGNIAAGSDRADFEAFLATQHEVLADLEAAAQNIFQKKPRARR